MDCISKSAKDTASCLQTKSVDELMKLTNIFDQCNSKFDFTLDIFKLIFLFYIAWPGITWPVTWQPTDDHDYVKNPFFKDHPRNVISSGKFNKVPTMIGANKDEGLLTSILYLAEPEKYKNFYYDNWKQCAAAVFLGQFDMNEKNSAKISKKVEEIEKYYFKNGLDLDTVEDFQNFTDVCTDSGFLYGTHYMAE